MGRTSGGVEARDSSIRLNFTLDGKRQRPTLMMNGKVMAPTPANLKYAHRLIAEICERIRTGTFSMAEYFPASGMQTAITVSGWLETWLKTKRIEKSSRSGYKAATRFWTAAAVDEKGNALGPMTLRAVKHSHILTCIANRPDLSGKTINNYVSVLRAAFELAMTDKMVTSNPAEGVPRANYQKPLPDPFSSEETDAIIGEAARAYSGNIHNMVEAWFWTGLRTSEILGLEWKNVDFLSAKMLVATVLVEGEEKDRTKTSIARLVNLNSRAVAALQRQRELTQIRGGRVFQDPRYSEDWLNGKAFLKLYWAPMLKRLGIRYRRPYNMRHSYATAMLMAGMKPAFCAKQLGHSVEVFLRTYAKWMDGDANDMEMARLETVLSPGRPRNKKESRKLL
ncbi:Arm DNA-binding domain-containing protein [Caballeronia sp. KNU42]